MDFASIWANILALCGKCGLELSKTHAARATRIFLAAHTAFCFAKTKNSVSAQEPISHTSKKGSTAQGGASFFVVRVRGLEPPRSCPH